MKVGLVGSGSWATAIVKMLSENLSQINWYVRSEYTKTYIEENLHNPKYLSTVEFDTEKLNITTNINKLVKKSDIIILATPSSFLEDTLEPLEYLLKEKIVFSAIKGVLPEKSIIVGEYLLTEHHLDLENLGVICGPCHAEEVAMERLSYLTVACEDVKKAEVMASLLRSDFIRVKTSDDIFGTEYGAVLKNIYSIAAGIAHGLGYGDNFQAVLMSNAIREMERFVKRIHPIKRNINNSAYLGDLLVTGYSFFSRNRMLGNMIGKGYTVKSALLEMNMVAEGYYAAKNVQKIAKGEDIYMPIAAAVHKVLYKEKNPKKVFAKLSEELD